VKKEINALFIEDGWLNQARRLPSPNFNQRPADADINLLVIHNISLPAGCYGNSYIEQLFTNCLDCSIDVSFESLRGLEVSAHVLIRRDGEIIQFVRFDDRAWHAGVSCFDGVENCNDYSIGIELEGVDTEAYSDVQYRVLCLVTQAIAAAYPAVTRERISGHEHIAPGRKTDPGIAFDWQRYYAGLADL
jgi:AmpD protein